MVLRSILLTHSISWWLLPACSSVDSVVCRCGFKTFNPVFSRVGGVEATSCPDLSNAAKSGRSGYQHAAISVGNLTGPGEGELGGIVGYVVLYDMSIRSCDMFCETMLVKADVNCNWLTIH